MDNAGTTLSLLLSPLLFFSRNCDKSSNFTGQASGLNEATYTDRVVECSLKNSGCSTILATVIMISLSIVQEGPTTVSRLEPQSIHGPL